MIVLVIYPLGTPEQSGLLCSQVAYHGYVYASYYGYLYYPRPLPIKMFASLQFNGEILNLRPRIEQPISSLYCWIVRQAPQLGHKLQECIFKLSGFLVLLLISFCDRACYFEVESWDLQYGAQNLTPSYSLGWLHSQAIAHLYDFVSL